MLTIHVDDAGFFEYMNAALSDQFPFAMAVALTNTAKDAADGEQSVVNTTIDSPKPFTRKALSFQRATKSKRVSSVFIKDTQARYLQYQIYGGDRIADSGKSISNPAKKTRLNKYGNLSRGKAKNLLKKNAKYFSGVPNGKQSKVSGVWKRLGKGGRKKLSLIIEFRKEVHYKKILSFEDTIADIVHGSFNKNFTTAFNKAMQTRRR